MSNEQLQLLRLPLGQVQAEAGTAPDDQLESPAVRAATVSAFCPVS